MGQTVLGISGSLGQGSYSTAILRTLVESDWGQNRVIAYDLSDLPLYNGDLEGDLLPESVQGLKEAISSADGLLLVSPEYNYGMPGS